MKDIKILCVGKVKEKYFRDGIAFFAGQINKKYPVSIVECDDEATPDRASEAEDLRIRETEGRKLLEKIREEDYVIALCIDGRQYPSFRCMAGAHAEARPPYLRFSGVCHRRFAGTVRRCGAAGG